MYLFAYFATIATLFFSICNGQEKSTSSEHAFSQRSVDQKMSYLIVINSEKAKIKKVSDQQFTLTLNNVSPHAMAFTDRPNRLGFFIDLKEFIKMWDVGANSFSKDPPNAGLVAIPQNSHAKQTNLMVTLTHPAYNPKKKTLTFTLTNIDPNNRIEESSLKETRLFIDNFCAAGFL